MNRVMVETVLKVSVHPVGDNPVFAETATHVSIEDEAGGFFVMLAQCSDDAQEGVVRLNPDELDIVLSVAKRLLNAAEYPPAKDKPVTKRPAREDKK